jgi:hypothetical protein
MLVRWCALLTIACLACLGCGRDPMRIAATDGAPAPRPADTASMAQPAGAADAADTAAPATGPAQSPDVSLPASPDAGVVTLPPSDGPRAPGDADACVPMTCDNPTCFPAYCGVIGDGCGGTLNCKACPAGWSCKGGQCLPDDCAPIACDQSSPYAYCGRIGDSCGGTLDCVCPNPDWTCTGHVCNRVASGCVPIPGCTTSTGDQYCGGLIGDGCGGVLDCKVDCVRPGSVCRNNLCVNGNDAGAPSGPVSPPPPIPPPPAPPPPPPPPCPPPFPPSPPLLPE